MPGNETISATISIFNLLSMKPRLIYALYKLDFLYPESLPQIAIDLIKSGIENQYLLELAGLNDPTKEQVGDLLLKGLEKIVDHEFDLFQMGLIIAQAIIDDEIVPYKGAFLIGELSEKLGNNEEFWKFKCHIIEFDDLEQDRGVSNLGYNADNIQIWQNEIIKEIINDSRSLLIRYKDNVDG